MLLQIASLARFWLWGRGYEAALESCSYQWTIYATINYSFASPLPKSAKTVCMKLDPIPRTLIPPLKTQSPLEMADLSSLTNFCLPKRSECMLLRTRALLCKFQKDTLMVTEKLSSKRSYVSCRSFKINCSNIFFSKRLIFVVFVIACSMFALDDEWRVFCD